MQLVRIKEIESGVRGYAFFINLREKGRTTVLLMARTRCEREMQNAAIYPRHHIRQLY